MNASDANRQTKENIDALNLCNCNKELLKEVEHEVNMSVAECSYHADVYVRDKDHFYDGYTEEEIKCILTYLKQNLGYRAVAVRTYDMKPSNHWQIRIDWEESGKERKDQ